MRDTRHAGAADVDRNIADAIARKGRRYKGNEMDVDDEYDHDVGVEMSAGGGGRKSQVKTLNPKGPKPKP